MDWDRVKIFHTVAEAGSFTHASELLNLSQSAISRQISALEESLGVPLFHRHARGLLLTEQGELLFSATRDTVVPMKNALALAGAARLPGNQHVKLPADHYTGIIFLPSMCRLIARQVQSLPRSRR